MPIMCTEILGDPMSRHIQHMKTSRNYLFDAISRKVQHFYNFWHQYASALQNQLSIAADDNWFVASEGRLEYG